MVFVLSKLVLLYHKQRIPNQLVYHGTFSPFVYSHVFPMPEGGTGSVEASNVNQQNLRQQQSVLVMVTFPVHWQISGWGPFNSAR